MSQKLPQPAPARVSHGAILTAIQQLQKEIQTFMASTTSGLSSLQAADTALASAVTAAIADIASLASEIAALTPEDSQVATLAADIQSKANALSAAVAPASPSVSEGTKA